MNRFKCVRFTLNEFLYEVLADCGYKVDEDGTFRDGKWQYYFFDDEDVDSDVYTFIDQNPKIRKYVKDKFHMDCDVADMNFAYTYQNHYEYVDFYETY